MNLGILNSGLRLSKSSAGLESSCGARMEDKTRPALHNRTMADIKENQFQVNRQKSFAARYFSAESLLVLVCLTAILITLPLILPPLPPPPFLLLLVPVGILFVLLILAFMPSDNRDNASSYL